VGGVPLSILHKKSGFWWEIAFFMQNTLISIL
jgi:hypothetical protein